MIETSFVIKRIEVDDIHLLYECWLRYLMTEPMYSTVRFDIVNDRDELLKIFKYVFKSDSPQMALWDKERNMAVGFQLSEVLSTPDPTGERGWDKANLPADVKERITLVEIFAEAHVKDTNVMRKYGVDRALLLNGLYIYDEYRGQGYARALVQATIEEGRQMGIKVVSSELSSYFTQKMFAKLGFETLKTTKFDGNLPTYNRMEATMKQWHKTFTVVAKVI